MPKYYYKNTRKINTKKLTKGTGIILILIGAVIFLYTSLPYISWQIYFAPVFASQNIQTPIPKTTVLDPGQISSLLAQAKNNIIINYGNAANWYPNYNPQGKRKGSIGSYTISIPKLNITNANVTTVDNNLDLHLVNYIGTAIPPEKGNAVIFGHSTLPQLFDQNNYKTIFANAYKLSVGDEISVNLPKVTYKYKVFNIIVVDPEDTSVLAQNYSDSFLTIITCTPPGTVWKRLIVRAKLESL